MEEKEGGEKREKVIKNLLNGSILHCLETATLGMPLEAWKTRMCIYRNENTVTSFFKIYNKGLGQFYAGFNAKLIESGSKGSVLLLSKEKIIKICNDLNINSTTSGFIGGACGGICQSLVMTPCTFFITASVENKINYRDKIFSIFQNGGISTLYKGNTAMCLRQGTNWASRQGITEWIRSMFIERKKKKMEKEGHEEDTRKNDDGQVYKIKENYTNNSHLTRRKDAYNLTPTEEILCGVIGGSLSVWNNPFDVIRVYMQNSANKNIKLTFSQSFCNLYKEGGILYLYKGVIPRCFLCIWQTLFMVTGIKILNKYF
ncbi:mitochondrial carrier protein, putative [Plasmodium ovale]|uniref:Mitochondrial carrier protein, putative n=1 Tax=Plasmodium ovale TaxID=36330 RepID=A0A1C3L5F8_PLAOA|nr:mitochondrial carrier protein, putative [Plasmodium ovale]